MYKEETHDLFARQALLKADLKVGPGAYMHVHMHIYERTCCITSAVWVRH